MTRKIEVTQRDKYEEAYWEIARKQDELLVDLAKVHPELLQGYKYEDCSRWSSEYNFKQFTGDLATVADEIRKEEKLTEAYNRLYSGSFDSEGE